MRISRSQMFMQMAHVVAQRSTCMRLNVGAIVVVNNRPVSIGYNGAPPGAPHCRGNDCPGRFSCRETIHAEKNAIDYVPPNLRTSRKDLYVTHSPCPACTDLILGERIDNVFFDVPYRLTDHLHRIPRLFQVSPAGWQIDYHSGDVIDA